jgi:NAD-dependent dihydropyrimidine dehydrogenase PreA subunit
MKNWRELSYGESDEPFVSQISYEQAQRIYNLFCERLSYTRTRSGPLRRKMPFEEKKRFMKSVYGTEIAEDQDTGKAMFPGLPSGYVEELHKAKAWFDRLREKTKEMERTLSPDWKQDELAEIGVQCGADAVGFARYYDPMYQKEMASLVFQLGMPEVNKLQVPSVAQYSLSFKKSFDIQNITNRIAEKIWGKGIFCDPAACATYYHFDNLEFNQVRFCEAAFDGRIGKHFVFMSKEFGPKFRMGQVLLPLPAGMKFPQPRFIDYCKGCTICVDACPSHALKIDDMLTCAHYFITHNHCSICMDVCPIGKDKG